MLERHGVDGEGTRQEVEELGLNPALLLISCVILDK